MPRPRSIYERQTTSVLPPPEYRERSHLVTENENLIVIASGEYGLEEYDSELWRLLGTTNKVLDPFTFDNDFTGLRVRVPARSLPPFT
jgi:hypothetical protein